MNKISKLLLIPSFLISGMLSTSNNSDVLVERYVKRANEKTQNTIYEIKDTSDIVDSVSFQTDYFDLSESKIRAIPFATSYDDLLVNELLGNEKAVLEENSNIYRVYDSDGYSYTLTYDYANSHYYFNSSYDGNIMFYLPSLVNIDNLEKLFQELNIDNIQLPYLSINGKRYVSIVYSNDDGIRYLLENGTQINQEKHTYFSGMGYSTKYMDLFTIPMVEDKVIYNIGKLNFNGYYNSSDDGFGEYDINFVPHSSMDGKFVSMPFEITTFDLEDNLPEVCIDYSTFTGIAFDGMCGDTWSWAISTTEYGYGSNGTLAPSEWAITGLKEYGNTIINHEDCLEDIDLQVVENKNYYDEKGVYHEVGETKIIEMNTSINDNYSSPGTGNRNNKYGGGVISGFDMDYIKTNNSYGTIKINDLSFYVKGWNADWAYVEEEHLITLDYSELDTLYFTYDSRPTMNVYYYQWDDYMLTRGGARINKIYIGFDKANALLNLWEWTSTSIEGLFTQLQVYGFDFYFDENKQFPIENIQSIEFDFEYNGNRYQRVYTETGVGAFMRYFGLGYDECNNLLTDYESWPRVCERVDEDGNEFNFDFALVHWMEDSNAAELKNVSPLEIVYLDENFSLQKAVSNSLGLHEVNGQMYDKDGNLRLDYTLKEIELTDSNGNKYMGYEITDKDGNIVDNTGTKIETTSKNPIDNIVDGKNPFDEFKNWWNEFIEQFEQILRYVIIAVIVIALMWLISIIVKVIKTLKKKGK